MKTMNSGRKTNLHGAFSSLAALLLCFVMCSAAGAQEASFEMEESASPPKGVKQMAAEMKKADERKNSLENKQSSSAAAPAGPSNQQQDKPVKDKTTYHGVFNLLSPLSPLFTIKTGNIQANFLSLANNTGNAASNISRSNMSGGYFFETNERDAGKIKKLAVKTQYNRQLRNSLSVNSMSEVSASVFGTGIKYNRAVSRAGGAGSMNVSDARRFSAEYKKESGLAISYNIDQNITRAIGAAPSQTNNRRQAWTLATPLSFRKGARLTLTHANTGNRNITGGSTTKLTQSDAKLDIPVSKNFEMNLAYQFLGNRNIAAGTVSENRKNTRAIGLSYKFADDTKFTYMYNFSANRNFSNITTNFDTVNRDAQFERALSSDAKMKLGYTTTYDQASGRTNVRTGNFTYDHKDFKYLPGATTINTRKQLTRSAGAANSNYTLSVGAPLTYLEGRLTANIQNSLTVQNNLVNDQRARSMNQTFSADYKLTERVTIGSNINRVKNTTATAIAASARSTARVRTDKMTYDFGKRLSVIKPLDGAKYSYAVTRNASLTDIPALSMNMNRVRNHMLDFLFKGAGWSGNYGVGRSFSLVYGAAAQRSLQHRIGVTIEKLWGCQVSANFTGAFQSSGSQTGEIIKITKKVDDKTAYYLNWEALKNKTRVPGATGTRNRYFEIGAELNL